MDNILKLNQLIEAVLNDNVSGLSLVTEEEQKQLKAPRLSLYLIQNYN